MSKYKKIIFKILSGQSDSNILFEDLLNLLKDNKFAKPYQVKQVRKIILKYKLGGLKDV